MKLQQLFEAKWRVKDAVEYIADMAQDFIEDDKIKSFNAKKLTKPLASKLAKELDAIDGDHDDHDGEESLVMDRLEFLEDFIKQNGLDK